MTNVTNVTNVNEVAELLNYAAETILFGAIGKGGDVADRCREAATALLEQTAELAPIHAAEWALLEKDAWQSARKAVEIHCGESSSRLNDYAIVMHGLIVQGDLDLTTAEAIADGMRKTIVEGFKLAYQRRGV